MNPQPVLQGTRSVRPRWAAGSFISLKVVAGLVEAARPGMWLKPLFLMLVASTYALRDFPSLNTFLGGFCIVGPLLWGGLYMMNAVTDVEDDKWHPVKKLRPFASNRVSTRLGSSVSIIMISAAVLLALQVNYLFAVCIIAMLLKQGAYTVPPLRLKRQFLWDVITGSAGNSTLRFASGWFLVTDSPRLPILLLIFSECLQLAGFLVNRLFTNYSSGVERKLNYASTTARLRPETIQRIIIGCWLIGITCFILLIINHTVQISPETLGVLPTQALIVLVLLLLAIPFFARAMQRAHSFSYFESQLYYDLPLIYVFVLSVILAFIIKLFG